MKSTQLHQAEHDDRFPVVVSHQIDQVNDFKVRRVISAGGQRSLMPLGLRPDDPTGPLVGRVSAALVLA